MMEASEISTNTSPLKLQLEEPFLGFASPGSLSGLTEDDLSQKFENIALRSSEEDSVDGSRSDHSGSDGGRLYPLRPYAEDCSFYLRTGTCKFGLNCRFNHPLRRANQVGKEGEEKEKEKDKPKTKEGLSEKSEQIECKYYLTPGGCKYGKSCRYNHLKDESEIVPPELNFLGLPIRLGEKECPFYMRTGSCGYGARCKFHHPDPTAVGAYGPHNSSPSNESIGQYGLHSGNDIVHIPSSVSGASQPAQVSWSSPMLSNEAVPYQDNHPSYMATKHFLPPGALQTPEWNRYQAPFFPEEKAIHPQSAPVGKSLLVKADGPSQFKEFPERPGQPECDYFMKTGDCKFRSACKYHHPKIQAPREDCALSDKGLPLRPGKQICWHYEQFGICKYGRACLFDHPVNKSSTPVGSVLRSP